MIKTKSLFTSICLFIVASSVVAQENKKQPLTEVLSVIGKQYNVTFSYGDETIQEIFVSPPVAQNKIKDILLYLQQATGLQFQQIGNRYIIVSETKPILLTACGYITNDDGEKLSGATVESNAGYAISDEDGNFTLPYLQKEDSITLRYLGYNTHIISAKTLTGIPCATVLMTKSLIRLPEIILTDYITDGIDKKNDGTFAINAKTLGMLPGLTEADMLQTIQALPGIQSINESISDINVRGGSNDQNLLLWDGIKMYHTGHFFGLISAFDPNLTKKVTLIRNGTTAEFGDGISSTIHIQTEDKLSNDFSGGAGVNLINGSVFAKIPLTKKTSLNVSSRRSIADLIRTPTYKQYFERAFKGTDVTNSSLADTLAGKNEKFNFQDVSLKFIYDLSPRDKIRISFLNVKNKIEYQENALSGSTIKSKTSSLDQGNLVSGISYSRLWSQRLRTSAQAYLSTYNLLAVNNDLKNDQRLTQENKVLDTGLKLNAQVSLTNKIDFLSGYQFYEMGVTNLEDINNPPFRRHVKKVIRSHAVFSEFNFDFPTTHIRIGVRGTYYPNFTKIILEPRLVFNQKIFNNFNFEILGEMKNQSSVQVIDLQSDFLGVEKRRWVLANNNDIPILQNKHISAGLSFKKKGLLLSSEVYYKLVEGVITSSQGFQNQFQFNRSSGSYVVMGADFLVSKTLNHFTIWASYSNVNNNYTFSQLSPSSFPSNFDVRHQINAGNSYEYGNFALSYGINWHSGKPYTPPDGVNPVLGKEINFALPNSARLDNYFRADVSLKYQFSIQPKMRVQIATSIWNILNTKNTLNAYYTVNEQGAPQPVYQNSLGLTPNFLIKVTF